MLHIEGELTVYTVARHKSEIFSALSNGCRDTELDLSGVSEMDTAGLQLLLAVRSLTLAGRGGFRITRPSTAVREVLDLCQLTEIFGCADGPSKSSGGNRHTTDGACHEHG